MDTTVKAHAPGPLLLRSELRSCEKVEVVVLGFPSLISLRFSVDVKQHSSNRLMFATGGH